jgi:FtsZ-interacting cell division protein ZipA
VGKLLIFVGIIAIVIILLGLWGYFLKTRENANKAGLTDHKKHIRDLERMNLERFRALEEIRDIATSSEAVSGDPLWSMVIDKVDAVLNKEGKK